MLWPLCRRVLERKKRRKWESYVLPLKRRKKSTGVEADAAQVAQEPGHSGFCVSYQSICSLWRVVEDFK